MNMTIDELLETPYWIIDILPKQVSKDSPGQYFAVEEYYLSKKQIAEVKNRHIGLVLKLNCYRDLSLDEETEINPPPGRIAEEMHKKHLCILTGDSMILSEPDDLHDALSSERRTSGTGQAACGRRGTVCLEASDAITAFGSFRSRPGTDVPRFSPDTGVVQESLLIAYCGVSNGSYPAGLQF